MCDLGVLCCGCVVFLLDLEVCESCVLEVCVLGDCVGENDEGGVGESSDLILA